jgi:hypothetical protein
MELSTLVRPVYMNDQLLINKLMRAILIDWLVEVHLKFKFVRETCYLNVNLIDCYLSKVKETRQRLQLLELRLF